MDLNIQPYVGVGPIRFGMTSEQVHHVAGGPVWSRDKTIGDQTKTLEDYPFLATLVFEGPAGKRKLVEITFDRDCKHVCFNNVRLFDVPPRQAFRTLLTSDPSAGECLGTVIFPALGISVTGLHDGLRTERSLTIFETGRMDEFLPMLKPLQR